MIHSDGVVPPPDRRAPSPQQVAPKLEPQAEVTRTPDPAAGPRSARQPRVNTATAAPDENNTPPPPATVITSAVVPQHVDLSSARFAVTSTPAAAGAAQLVDAADGPSRGASTLSGNTAGGSAQLGDSSAGRTAAAFAGGTVLATLTLPASTTFGADAAVSPAVQGEAPAGVLAVATDSLVMAARWAAQGLGGDTSIELGSAAVQGSLPGRAFDAMRFFMPAQVLGLAPGWATDASEEDQEAGNWGWKLTAVVSLAATLTGYWYCNKTADRRRQASPGAPPKARAPVQRARRVYPGSHPPGGRELLAH
jgi:hypothetical protein